MPMKPQDSMNLNSNNLTIHLLAERKQDIPYLAALHYEQIGKHWVPHASIERSTENLIKHINTNTLPLTLVALANNKPVGMASLRENDGIQPRHAPWLGSLIVDPAYRKQKIGEQLIDAIKQKAVDFGYHQLYLLAFDPTIPEWYASLGWAMIGNAQLFNHPVTVMKIKL